MNLSSLVRYLVLPAEITDFERRYLARMNRIALVFFWLHVPVLAAVALACDTGPLRAIVLSTLLLAGPSVAYRVVKNPRSLSIFYGVTAMGMGGLLVHFGQGPMQIEMHFYFFVLLALLAVFANPMAIIAAAVTVALHHAILFFVLPSSVFNYDASIWTVAVHALFVVLESVAACFVARSFFDNVIGLDRIVQARTAEIDARSRAMRLVLDNVDQGLVTVGRDGVMQGESSSAAERFLGADLQGTSLASRVGARDPVAGGWIEAGWDTLFDDVLPRELALDQLPKHFRDGERHYALSYLPIDAPNGGLERLLVVVSDQTAAKAAARAEEAQREVVAMFERIVQDRAAFFEFLREGNLHVSRVTSRASSGAEIKHALHTLKGNAALYGASSIAEVTGAIEANMHERCGPISDEERDLLQTAWTSLAARLQTVLRERSAESIEISISDVDEVLQSLLAKARPVDVAKLVARLEYEPVSRRFARFAEQAVGLARRLGRAELDVHLETAGLRLPAERWAPFWGAFVHVVRNAVDHGLESSAERSAAGKPEHASLTFRAEQRGDELEITVTDDGRGIDWDAIDRQCEARGLPHATQAERVEALFTTGFTTREKATDLSGRGVGLGAAREAVRALGGQVTVSSERGAGTTLVFRVPGVAMLPGRERAAAAVRTLARESVNLAA